MSYMKAMPDTEKSKKRQTKKTRPPSVAEQIADALGEEIVEMIRRYIDAGAIEIFTGTVTRSVSELVTDYKHGRIYVNPLLMRAWSWNRRKMSKLIETIWVESPSPVVAPLVVMTVEKGGKEILIDGRHRLETLRKYIDGEFVPTRVIKPLDRKRFSRLSGDDQSRILRAHLMVQTITVVKKDPNLPDEEFRRIVNAIMFETFRRLNTGQNPMTSNQVLLSAVDTPLVLEIRRISELPEYKNMYGELKESEQREMIPQRNLLFLSLLVKTNGSPIAPFGSARQKYLRDLRDLLLESNAEKIREITSKVEELVRIAGSIGVTREMLLLRTYDPSVRVNRVNLVLFMALFYTLYKLCIAEGKKDLVLKNADKVREALTEAFRDIATKYRSDLRMLITRGKENIAEKLYNYVLMKVGSAIGA